MTNVIDYESNEEIQIFREYLRIATVHPNPNYEPCVAFLTQLAAQLHLTVRLEYPAHPSKPVVILTWSGSEPHQPSIILNSHMDVVPVYADRWQHAPFGAELDAATGRIYARGSQDMKSVGMQYLSAIRRLQQRRQQLRRTVHILFVPDEEIGGTDGMMAFVRCAAFRELAAGFALDEGIASPGADFPVFYAERSVWRVHFRCTGTGGHGSLLHSGTPGEKLRRVVDSMMDRREIEVGKLEAGAEAGLLIGDVTTLNLTVIEGGVQTNVVPPEMTVGFDIRLALDVDHGEFQRWLEKVASEAGDGVELRYEAKKPKVPATVLDETNAFWVAFEKVLVGDLKLDIRPQIFPGRTDSCFIREVGIPALGFSPLNHTPVLLHDHDEFVAADVYLRGIDIYVQLIEALADV